MLRGNIRRPGNRGPSRHRLRRFLRAICAALAPTRATAAAGAVRLTPRSRVAGNRIRRFRARRSKANSTPGATSGLSSILPIISLKSLCSVGKGRGALVVALDNLTVCRVGIFRGFRFAFCAFSRFRSGRVPASALARLALNARFHSSALMSSVGSTNPAAMAWSRRIAVRYYSPQLLSDNSRSLDGARSSCCASAGALASGSWVATLSSAMLFPISGQAANDRLLPANPFFQGGGEFGQHAKVFAPVACLS